MLASDYIKNIPIQGLFFLLQCQTSYATLLSMANFSKNTRHVAYGPKSPKSDFSWEIRDRGARDTSFLLDFMVFPEKIKEPVLRKKILTRHVENVSRTVSRMSRVCRARNPGSGVSRDARNGIS